VTRPQSSLQRKGRGNRIGPRGPVYFEKITGDLNNTPHRNCRDQWTFVRVFKDSKIRDKINESRGGVVGKKSEKRGGGGGKTGQPGWRAPDLSRQTNRNERNKEREVPAQRQSWKKKATTRKKKTEASSEPSLWGQGFWRCGKKGGRKRKKKRGAHKGGPSVFTSGKRNGPHNKRGDTINRPERREGRRLNSGPRRL